jgi:hypothetical protein
MGVLPCYELFLYYVLYFYITFGCCNLNGNELCKRLVRTKCCSTHNQAWQRQGSPESFASVVVAALTVAKPAASRAIVATAPAPE